MWIKRPRPLTTLALVAASCVSASLAAAQPASVPAARAVTILYTNDFHSAVDPIPAYWLPGTPRLGGAAQLATLVNRIRERERPVFLLDAGDVFTGTFSFLSRGEALMELLAAMRYDALGIGNHELDYGSAVFEPLMWRAPFPVLGANVFHTGTRHRWARPWAVVERDGIRIGVIGVMGIDAWSVINAAGIPDIEFGDPVEQVAAGVAALRSRVDLVVVLAHQGKTGPMQTDAEALPEIQRDFDTDIALAGAVPGIDVLIGGHAHRGIEVPYVHPSTGTRIVQTYGYGTRLGYLKLRLQDGKVAGHEGSLLVVHSDELPPDPAVVARLEPFRKAAAPALSEVVGQASARLVRRYNLESPLGDFVADVMRESTGAEIAFENAGGLRADLPEGVVTRAHVVDALPFINTVVTLEMTGTQVREVLEQGLTLERGLVQVSGLEVTYDPTRPAGSRLLAVKVGGQPLDDGRSYRVATNSFLALGGDLYATFPRAGRVHDSKILLVNAVIAWFRTHGIATPPPLDRYRTAHR
ncbi:MAG: bifunctional metallophosphatase/5'-nucleotidase [Thermoanaerobaculaceae bacterium]